MKKGLMRNIGILMVMVMLLSMLVGCTTGSNDKDKDKANVASGEFSEPEKISVTICGGSIGGAWAAIGEGVGETIRRSYSGSNVSYEVGQEAANISLVSSGKIQLGIAHTGLIKLAMENKEPFTRDASNLRALAVLYGEAAQHFLIKTDSGMDSFDKIKENKYPLKLNLNTKDSFMEIIGKKSLEANGITYDDIISWGGSVDFMSMGASIDLMRDGKVESYSNVIQVPSSHILDASTNLKLNLLPLSDEAIDIINKDLGTYKAIISKEKYPFLKEDVQTVAATVILFASDELSDGEAYAIVKSMDENLDYFKAIHSSLKDLDLKTMTEVSPIPLHPGAERYYKEKGAL